MNRVQSCIFPDVPPDLSSRIFRDDRELVIIGVIGKSFDAECNKMAGLDMIKFALESNATIANGQIRFYFNESDGNSLFIHFQTAFDEKIMEQLLHEKLTNTKIDEDKHDSDTWYSNHRNHNIHSFHTLIRSKFAQILLFAIQVCHIIIVVEPSNVFDTSYLSIFKALKVTREKYVLKFLPKFLKNSSIGSLIGKEGRLCSPRFIFYFEKALYEYSNLDALQRYEFEIEDCIYKMLRNELVITNNSLNSLFSIPRNKRFVCMNTNPNLRADSVTEAVNLLGSYISKKEKNQMVFRSNNDNETDSDDEIRPFKGFAKPLSKYKCIEDASDSTDKSNRLLELIKEHVEEALQNGFDDSIAKYKGKSHFVVPSAKAWYEFFMFLHRIFIENPDNPNFEPNDPDYKAYLDNFAKIADLDDRYYTECCEYGLELAIENYKEMLPHFYSKNYHEQKMLQSMLVLLKYGRGPHLNDSQRRLTDMCNEIWLNGCRQQCEALSLTGNPCAMPKHLDDEGHNSGETYISTCNCGRTQGRRSDPYTVRQANFEFYQIMRTKCSSCTKLDSISFAVFEPSINDYRAADNETRSSGNAQNIHPEDEDDDYQVLSMPSQLANANLSIGSGLSFSTDEENNDDANNGIRLSMKKSDDNVESDHGIISGAVSDPEEVSSVNEIVIQVGGEENEEESGKPVYGHSSTTEYLSGMITTVSKRGLLPQFPSWCLVNIGHSSVYSHNLGLSEHAQSGFLSGANFLLPWDVQVRLENAGSWARSLGKQRNRRKPQPIARDLAADDAQNVFMLKIFIGCEMECPCGHRFFMSSPNTILRGGMSGIAKDAGSKIVFNEMPLYFPCPCRTSKPRAAQLMRIHMVTPKAPVNLIIEPKVRTGNKVNYTFLPGSDEPTKLSQSAYWILRLPYIYEGNDGPIMRPLDISESNYMSFGCLLAGMYGIVETRSK